MVRILAARASRGDNATAAGHLRRGAPCSAGGLGDNRGFARAILQPLPYLMPGSERQRELRRRRKRRESLSVIKERVAGKRGAAPSPSEKVEIARKLRAMTPGAEELIKRFELEQK